MKRGPILLLLQYATLGHTGMFMFNFVVLSVTIDLHNVLTAHISETHLPIVSLNIRELELILKRAVKEKRISPSTWEVEAQLPNAKYYY